MREKICEIFTDMINEIRRLEKFKKLSLEHEELLKNSIQWLKDHQHPDGYWGYESVADTALVLLAFSIYGVRDEEWLIKGRHVGGLKKAINWLKSIRNVDNWENNLWDTSVCLQALYKLGIREEWVFKVTEWVKNRCKQRERIPLHHLAQAVNALLDAGLDEDAKKVSEIIASEIEKRLRERKEGEHLFGAYVTGQVLDALVRSGYSLTAEIMRACEMDLRRFLEEVRRTGISEATFQDVMMAFLGLASFLGGEDNELINSILAEIFKSPERYKRDGSWYHDAKKTAFALIGVSKVKEVRKIDEISYRVYRIIIDYQKRIEDLLGELESAYKGRILKVRQGYLWLSLAFGSILASLIIAVTLGIESIISQLIIGSLLIPGLFSTATKAYLSFKGKIKV